MRNLNSQQEPLNSVLTSLSNFKTKPSEWAVEQPICISVNGIAHAVMMVTPSELENFSVGFAYGEKIISDIGQLRDISISEDTHNITTTDSDIPIACIVADLTISPRQLKTYKEKQTFRRGLTSCGLCGSAALSEALPELEPLKPAGLPSPEDLLDIHKRTQFTAGMHVAHLMNPSGTQLISQHDIGRHNALDKALGFALRKGINLHQHYAILSSRCSVELVQKAVRVGLSTLVHLSSPSNLAIEMAQHYQLNLIQVTRSGEIKVHARSQSDKVES